MDQRLSLITLGVADVARAQAFYESMGWKMDGGVDDDTDHVAFFQAGGIIVALWDRGKLARDSVVEDEGGWGGITLAYNVGDPQEVDAVLAQAEAAGARIGRPAEKTFWGGYSGLFLDPDGHPWEVAHNPGWTVHEDGRTTLS
jgi:catechol 2,3-dioxygenase-like lactoylglutathione lyase family enzyme